MRHNTQDHTVESCLPAAEEASGICPVFISTASIPAADPLIAIDRLRILTRNIELTGGGDYDDNVLERLISYKDASRANFLLHSYFPPPREHFVLNFAETGAATREFICRAMECVQALDVPYYSIHAGFRTDFTADGHGLLHPSTDRIYTLDGIKENVSWFRSRWPRTPLALENVYPNNGNTACAFMMSVDEICDALDAMPDIFLLLDLGHLKISANLMGFDFIDAVTTLFTRYGQRIIELHISENGGEVDDHFPITRTSGQYHLIDHWRDTIQERGINVTLEIRGVDVDTIAKSYTLAKSVFCR